MIPRGALAEATRAVIAAARDFGTGDGARVTVAGKAEDLARAAVVAALPAIERAARKDAATRILALHAEDYTRHHAPGARNVGPWNDMRTVLRKVARGEPIPDLPASPDKPEGA